MDASQQQAQSASLCLFPKGESDEAIRSRVAVRYAVAVEVGHLLFCVVAGPALALAAHFGLIAIGFQVAPPALVIVQFFYIIKVGPLLLAATPTILATGLVPLSRHRRIESDSHFEAFL
jgi:hypothetical protein